MTKAASTKLKRIRVLYEKQGYSMQAVADKLGMSINAVTYHMRKNGIKRRSASEASAALFEKKALSFEERKKLSANQERLRLSALMLYWAEGYKSPRATGIDFANSDPDMILIFVRFLRTIYRVNERRFRVLLYSYSDQDMPALMSFWSKLTKIPQDQFSKPYVRADFRENGRKMKYGMVHVRYADKKLFLCIMEAIQLVKAELRVDTQVVNGGRL